MIGGCVWTNSLSAKNSVRLAIDLDRNWRRRALNGRRARMCGIVRRYSADWYFFCKGKVYTTSDTDLVRHRSHSTTVSLALRRWVGFSHTAGSEAPSSETSFTWSSHDCALLLGDAVQFPVKRTAAPVERLSILTLALYLPHTSHRVRVSLYLCACSGVSIACSGSKLEPSPIEAKARVFCFRIERTKP